MCMGTTTAMPTTTGQMTMTMVTSHTRTDAQ